VIAQFDTRVNEQTRAIRARAEFPNPSGRLKPGMLMRVSIDKGVRQALAAPEAAVQFSADQSFVYVVARQGGRLVAQQQTVVTGANEAGMIEIKDGLRSGDQIVADGLNRLQPNQALRLAPSTVAAAAPAGPSAAVSAR
jgi:membrane fusion protein (multidrug efflux system)